MRKIIVLAAIMVIAAVVVVWSKSFGPGNGVPEVGATEASLAIFPMEIMVKKGKDLPHERWEPAF